MRVEFVSISYYMIIIIFIFIILCKSFDITWSFLQPAHQPKGVHKNEGKNILITKR